MRRIEKPKEGQYPPYAIIYVELLPDDGLVLRHMRENLNATTAFIFGGRHSHALAPRAEHWSGSASGKWHLRLCPPGIV